MGVSQNLDPQNPEILPVNMAIYKLNILHFKGQTQNLKLSSRLVFALGT